MNFSTSFHHFLLVCMFPTILNPHKEDSEDPNLRGLRAKYFYITKVLQGEGRGLKNL